MKRFSPPFALLLILCMVAVTAPLRSAHSGVSGRTRAVASSGAVGAALMRARTLSLASPLSSRAIHAERSGVATDIGPFSFIHPPLHPAPHPPLATGAIPIVAGTDVAGPDASVSGFPALRDWNQLHAGSGKYVGTQSPQVPPDQGLCVGHGFVLEVINLALQVYRTSGISVGATLPLNQFYNVPPLIVRSNPPVFGPVVFDPRCYYDADTGRWFVSTAEFDVNPSTGQFGPRTHLELAVSQTSDPSGAWYLYSIDVTDDGTHGTPNHAGCPCSPDYPMIGADKYGFYISENEYPLAGSTASTGDQIFALSKMALEAGTLPPFVHLDNVLIGSQKPLYLQPASSPNGVYNTGQGGTEYLLSTLDPQGTGSTRIVAWALTNTSSLATGTPHVSLSHVVVPSEAYAPAPTAAQRPGRIPLADYLNDTYHDGDTLERLDTSLLLGDALQQTVFAHGLLWAGVNTAVQQTGGITRSAIAYFVVAPAFTGGALTATIATQGYEAVTNEDVMYPSIGVNTAGQGAMSFTLAGPDNHPSAAYAYIDAAHGAGPAHVAAAGTRPDDSFGGYHHFGGSGVDRWGDYSAAVADTDGSIWLASEYINSLKRDPLANWATFISHTAPLH